MGFVVSVVVGQTGAVVASRDCAGIDDTVAGLILPRVLRCADLLVMVAWVLGIAAVLSFIAIVLPPHVGLEPGPANAGAWKGIFFRRIRWVVIRHWVWSCFILSAETSADSAAFGSCLG